MFRSLKRSSSVYLERSEGSLAAYFPDNRTNWTFLLLEREFRETWRKRYENDQIGYPGEGVEERGGDRVAGGIRDGAGARDTSEREGSRKGKTISLTRENRRRRERDKKNMEDT